MIILEWVKNSVPIRKLLVWDFSQDILVKLGYLNLWISNIMQTSESKVVESLD